MSQKSTLSSIVPNRGAMRLFVGTVLIAASALAAQPSFARGDHHGGGHGHGMMMDGGGPRHLGRMLDFVEATDAQRAEIKVISEAAAAEAKPLREQGRALRQKALAMMNSANAIDRSAAENLRMDMMKLHEQASKIRMDAMLDVADKLTPQQRAKIGTMMAKRGERQREHMMKRGADAAPKS